MSTPRRSAPRSIGTPTTATRAMRAAPPWAARSCSRAIMTSLSTPARGRTTGGLVSSRGAFVTPGAAAARETGGGSSCSSSTRIIAATGTARNVPASPNSSLPAKIASTIQNGESPTFSFSTRGEMKLPSI